MTPRKYVPLVIGALLLAALLLIQFSRSTDPATLGKPDRKSDLPPTSGEDNEGQLKSLHVNVSLPEEEFKQLSQYNRHFMIKHPHILVKLTNEPEAEEAYALWQENSQLGAAADIMLLNNGWVRPFAVQGYLQAVDSAWTGDALSDQMAGLLEPLKWNGYLWGVPLDVNPYIIVWSRTLLVQSGLNAPPKDAAALQAAASRMIEQEETSKIVNWSPGDMYQQLVWLATFSTERTSIIQMKAFNKEQAELLVWMEEIEKHIGSIPADSINDLNDAFLNHNLLAAVLPWDLYEELNPNTREGLLIDRKAVMYPWLNGRSFVIASSSPHAEEAILWIQAMADAEYQQSNYGQFNRLPARASLYTNNSYLQENDSESTRRPPEWWKVVLDAKEENQLPVPDPLWPEKWQYRTELWQEHSENGIQLQSYREALTID